LIRDTVVHHPRDLESLAHRVDLVGRAEVAQERGGGGLVAERHERLDEFIEALRGLGIGFGGGYFATGHFTMLTC
jgi:hypothetical protein